MANVVIVTVGTRGDVVPYAALGSALAATGDHVTIATHSSLRSHVDRAGLEFAALPVELTTDPPLTSSRFARQLAARWLDIGRAIRDAATGADVLLLSPMGLLGYHVAEATGAASMGAFLQPLEPTRAFLPSILSTRSLGGWGNRAVARAFRVAGQLPFARATALFRAELGLAPLSPAAMFRRMEEQCWPAVYGFSPAVIPVPQDWPAHRPITGYWWPPAAGELSAPVRDFLDDGEPPVYLGFGSLVEPRLRDLVEQTVARLGRRVVLHRSTGLAAGHRDVLVVGDEPHSLLFPRMAVVVHHGGAGTTGAALRAGVPSVVVPFTADQPFWALRTTRIGAGPPPVALRHATADRLAAAIGAAEAYRAGALLVSRRLAAEDGIGVALAQIRRLGLPVQ